MLKILCELPMLLRILHADQIKLRSTCTGTLVTTTDAGATYVLPHARFARADTTTIGTAPRDFATTAADATRATQLGSTLFRTFGIRPDPSTAATGAGDGTCHSCARWCRSRATLLLAASGAKPLLLRKQT